MDIPSASGFRSDNGSTTLLSSPRSGQRFQTSAVTLPQASFKPMDVTLKLRSAVYFADVAKARVAILAGADVNSSNPENHNETMLVSFNDGCSRRSTASRSRITMLIMLHFV